MYNTIYSGFFTDSTSALTKAFQNAANKERENFKFIFTTDADTAKEYGYNK